MKFLEGAQNSSTELSRIVSEGPASVQRRGRSEDETAGGAPNYRGQTSHLQRNGSQDTVLRSELQKWLLPRERLPRGSPRDPSPVGGYHPH